MPVSVDEIDIVDWKNEIDILSGNFVQSTFVGIETQICEEFALPVVCIGFLVSFTVIFSK